jgi:hypothetical protein
MDIKYILDRLDSIDEKFDGKLDAILVQTTRTNGRVNGLESWKAFVNKVVWSILAIVLTVVGFFLQNWISKK